MTLFFLLLLLLLSLLLLAAAAAAADAVLRIDGAEGVRKRFTISFKYANWLIEEMTLFFLLLLLLSLLLLAAAAAADAVLRIDGRMTRDKLTRVKA